jgi:hypothetical protein
MDLEQLLWDLRSELKAALDPSDRTFLDEFQCQYLIDLIEDEIELTKEIVI